MSNVKNLTELTAFVIDLGEAVAESFEDGKITFMDAGNFISVFSKIGPALKDIHLVPNELIDISQDELAEIIAYIEDEFDIENDVLEARVEQALDTGLRLAKFIGTLIKE